MVKPAFEGRTQGWAAMATSPKGAEAGVVIILGKSGRAYVQEDENKEYIGDQSQYGQGAVEDDVYAHPFENLLLEADAKPDAGKKQNHSKQRE